MSSLDHSNEQDDQASINAGQQPFAADGEATDNSNISATSVSSSSADPALSLKTVAALTASAGAQDAASTANDAQAPSPDVFLVGPKVIFSDGLENNDYKIKKQDLAKGYQNKWGNDSSWGDVGELEASNSTVTEELFYYLITPDSGYTGSIDLNYTVRYSSSATPTQANNSFTILEDNESPIITRTSPNSDEPIAHLDSVPLSLYFNEQVELGSGNITLQSGDHKIVFGTEDFRLQDIHYSSTIPSGAISSKASSSWPSAYLNTNPEKTGQGVQIKLGSNYHVLIDEGFFIDKSGTAFAGVNDNTTITFETDADVTAPQLNTESARQHPRNNSITNTVIDDWGFVDFRFDFYFDEKVKAGSGDITITNGSDDIRTYSVSAEDDAIFRDSGDAWDSFSTFFRLEDKTEPLKYGEDYYVLFDKGTFVDESGNIFEGLDSPTDWKFRTEFLDIPANEGTSAVINYNKEDLSKNNLKQSIYGSSDDDWFKIVIEDNGEYTFRIDPLDGGGGNPYTLTIDDQQLATQGGGGYISENTGNWWDGYANLKAETTKYLEPGTHFLSVASYGAWDYSLTVSADTTAPTVYVASTDYNSNTVDPESRFELTFDDKIFPGSGNILITDENGETVEKVDIASDQVTIRNNILAVKPSTTLNENTAYRIEYGEGVVLDRSNNSSAAENESAISFNTGTANNSPANLSHALAIPRRLTNYDYRFSWINGLDKGTFFGGNDSYQEVALCFDQSLSRLNETPIDAFNIAVNGEQVPLKSYRIVDNVVYLKPDGYIEIETGQILEAGYTQPEGDEYQLQSITGANIDTTANRIVSNDVDYAIEQGSVEALNNFRSSGYLQPNDRKVYSFIYTGQSSSDITPNSRSQISKAYYELNEETGRHEIVKDDIGKLENGKQYYLVVADVNYQNDQAIYGLNNAASNLEDPWLDERYKLAEYRENRSGEKGIPFVIGNNVTADPLKQIGLGGSYMHDLGKVTGEQSYGLAGTNPYLTLYQDKPDKYLLTFETDATAEHSISLIRDDFIDENYLSMELSDIQGNSVASVFEYKSNGLPRTSGDFATKLELDGITAGKYLLEINHSTSADKIDGIYGLHFDAPPPLTIDQADEEGSSHALQLGSVDENTILLSKAINDATDIDRYRFSIDQDTKVNEVVLQFDHSQADLQLALHQAGRDQPIYTSESDPDFLTKHNGSGYIIPKSFPVAESDWIESINIANLPQGSYDLLVSSPNNEVEFYNLSFKPTASKDSPEWYESYDRLLQVSHVGPDNPHDSPSLRWDVDAIYGSGNDTLKDAVYLGELKPGQSTLGQFSINTSDDVDYYIYKITGDSGLKVDDLTVKYDSGDGLLDVSGGSFKPEDSVSWISSQWHSQDIESQRFYANTHLNSNDVWQQRRHLHDDHKLGLLADTHNLFDRNYGIIKVSGVDGATNSYTIEAKTSIKHNEITKDENDRLATSESVVDLKIAAGRVLNEQTIHSKDDVDAYKITLLATGTVDDFVYTKTDNTIEKVFNLLEADGTTFIKAAEYAENATYVTESSNVISLAGLPAGDYVVEYKSDLPTKYSIGVGPHSTNIDTDTSIEDRYDSNGLDNNTKERATDLGVIGDKFSLEDVSLFSSVDFGQQDVSDIDYYKFQVSEDTKFNEITWIEGQHHQIYTSITGTNKSLADGSLGFSIFDQSGFEFTPHESVGLFEDSVTIRPGMNYTGRTDMEEHGQFRAGEDYYLKVYGSGEYQIDFILPPGVSLPDNLFPDPDRFDQVIRNDEGENATQLGDIEGPRTISNLTFDGEVLDLTQSRLDQRKQAYDLGWLVDVDAFNFELLTEGHLFDDISIVRNQNSSRTDFSNSWPYKDSDSLGRNYGTEGTAEIWSGDWTTFYNATGKLDGLPAGEYGLVARSKWNLGEGVTLLNKNFHNPYSIDIDVSKIDPNTGHRLGDVHEGVDGNDTIETATPFKSTDVYQGEASINGSLHSKHDDDFFKFTITEKVSAQLTDSSQTAPAIATIIGEEDIDLYLLNSDRDVLSQSEDFGRVYRKDAFGNNTEIPRFGIDAMDLQPGDYYLKVQPNQVQRTLTEEKDFGDYTLNLNLHYPDPLPSDRFEFGVIAKNADGTPRYSTGGKDPFDSFTNPDLGVITENGDGTPQIIEDLTLELGAYKDYSYSQNMSERGSIDTYEFTLNHKPEAGDYIKVNTLSGDYQPRILLLPKDLSQVDLGRWDIPHNNKNYDYFREWAENWDYQRGSEITKNYPIRAKEISLDAWIPGEYVLQIGPGHRGDYSLEFDGPPNPHEGSKREADRYDRRNLLDISENAIQIDQATNQTVIDDLNIHYANDTDYFKFTLPRKGLASDSIELAGDHLSKISFADQGKGNGIRLTKLNLEGYSPGEHIISVEYAGDKSEAAEFEPIKYSLIANNIAEDSHLYSNDLYETLEDATNNVDLGLIQNRFQLNDQAITLNDIDNREFTLASVGSNKQGLGIRFDHLEGDLKLDLINIEDQEIVKTADFSTEGKSRDYEWLSLEGMKAGNYQARISGQPNNYDFELITNSNLDNSNQDNKNSSIESATPITRSMDELEVLEGNAYTYDSKGNISQYGYADLGNLIGTISNSSFKNQDNIDYYKFSTAFDSSYKWIEDKDYIQVDFWDQLGNVDLELLSSDGKEVLDYSHGFGNSERIELIDLPADDYIIKVIGRGEDNSYSLHYDLPSRNYRQEDSLDNKTTQQEIEQAIQNGNLDLAYEPDPTHNGPEWAEIASKLRTNQAHFNHEFKDVDATLSPDNREDWYKVEITERQSDRAEAVLNYDPKDGAFKLEAFELKKGDNTLTSLGWSHSATGFETTGPDGDNHGIGTYYFRVSSEGDSWSKGVTDISPYNFDYKTGREAEYFNKNINWNKRPENIKPLGDVFDDQGSNDWFNSALDPDPFNFDSYTYELDDSVASGQFVGKQELTHTAMDNPRDYADIYQFNLRDSANENHFIQAEFEEWDMDLDLYLFDQNNPAFKGRIEHMWEHGNSVVEKWKIWVDESGNHAVWENASLSNSDNESINLDGLPEGEYLLAVKNRISFQNTAEYDLTFNLPEKTISADPYEINNNPDTLFELGSFTGRRRQDNLSIHDSNDVDYIGFETKYAGAEGDYINLDYIVNDGELKFDLIDRTASENSSENIIKSSKQHLNGSTLSLEGVVAGKYSIRVSGADLGEPDSNGNDKATNNYQIEYVLPTNPDRLDAWTLMYYFPAYQDIDMHYTINLLEAQIKEWDLPDEVNFAIMWDQPDWVDLEDNKSTGAGEQAKWDTTGRSILRSDNTTKWISSDFEVLDEKNMGDPTTVTEFIQWANRVAPAENQALFIHGHSSGLYSIVDDNEARDPLYVEELAESLEQLKQDDSIDLEILRMDGCLTGTLELAYELKDSAQVTIGSENVSGAGSGTYLSHAQALTDYPHEYNAALLASTMVEDYKANYVKSRGEDTLSAIKTDQLDLLATSISAFVDTTENLTSEDRHRLEVARSFAPQYRGGSNTTDLGQFMRGVTKATKLNQTVRDAAQQVVEAIEAAVINKNNDYQNSDGISIFYPQGGGGAGATYIDRHSKFIQATNWDRYLELQSGASLGSADWISTPVNDWSASNTVASGAFDLGRLSGNDIDIDSLAINEATSKYFRFTLVDTAHAETTIEFSSPTATVDELKDLKLTLFDTQDQKLQIADENNKLALQGLEAAEYLLEITNNGAPIPGASLKLNLPNDPTPFANYNNLENKATKLGLVAGPKLKLGTTSPSTTTEDGEWLYYNIETPSLSGIQQQMNVEVNVADGAEYEAVILDSNNQVVSTTTGIGSNSLDYSTTGSGEEYTLKLRQLKQTTDSEQSALAPPGASSTFSLLFTPGEAVAASVNDDGQIVETGSTLNQSEAIALILDQGNQVTIPEGYGSIGDSAFKDRDLANVVIADSVTEIGDNAFFNTQLTTVEIPNSVTSIGDNAFFNTQLASVDLGNNISSIGNNAFQNTQLTSVELGDSVQSIGDSAFMDTPLASVVIGNSITTIANNAFRNTELTQVEIPNSVTSIGVNAFINTQLASVVIPDSVTSIGESAFAGTKLTSVDIGSGVTSIGPNAFYNTQLASVVIPNGVATIGDNAFFNTQLTTVEIPNSVTSIGDKAFFNTQLASVVIPDSVSSIGRHAFASTKLTSVDIGSGVRSIGQNAFSDTQLASVVIPNGVTTIGGGAFLNTQLASVVIPDSVTSIGESAFAGTKLTSVDIGSGVTSIGPNAFYDTQLASVVIPNGVTTIAHNAFRNTELTQVEIPASLTSINDNVFKSTNLSSVVIPDSVTSIGRGAFSDTHLTSVEIPNSVTEIGEGAFDNTQLTSVVIPDSVTRISDGVFRDTPLTSLVIGKNVISIGDEAFSGTQLTSVVIPSTVTSIGDNAFQNSQLTSAVIGDGVTSIGDNAFSNTQLKTVEIPASVTSIGDGAFDGTPLTTVFVPEGFEIDASAFDSSVVITTIGTGPDIRTNPDIASSWAENLERTLDSDLELGYSLHLKEGTEAEQATARKQLAVLGDSVDLSDIYQLDITAKSLAAGYNLETADITINFDPYLFNEIKASDITIGGQLPIANAVRIDNDVGTIRIAAASLGDLDPGDLYANHLADAGSSIGSDGAVLASIDLNFNELNLAELNQNSDGSIADLSTPLFFGLSANQDETVFSKALDDESGFVNREIKSLRDLGGDLAVDGTKVTLYEATINLEEQGDGLILSSDLDIGSYNSKQTNLLRSGDTISTTSTWTNLGNIEAQNIQVTGITNSNAQLLEDQSYFAYQGIDANGDQVTRNILNSGSFRSDTGAFDSTDQESGQLHAAIKITGAAGNVVDLGLGIASLKADGSELFSNQKGSKNLITFQGDLNYDGRVSMKDLAYLNAGAARQQQASEDLDAVDANGDGFVDASVARGVDANFDGQISMADLAVLDADWGQSLHQQPINGANGTQSSFTGSDQISWEQLDNQGTTGDATWDNQAFKDQNAVEAGNDFVESLENPTAVGVIGADGNSDSSDNDIAGDYFQDPLTG